MYPKLSAVEVTGRDGGPVEVERDKMLVQRMMGDDVVVARLEALIIEQTEPARAERALEPYEGTNA